MRALALMEVSNSSALLLNCTELELMEGLNEMRSSSYLKRVLESGAVKSSTQRENRIGERIATWRAPKLLEIMEIASHHKWYIAACHRSSLSTILW